MIWSIKNMLAALFALLAVVTGVQGAITLEALMRIEHEVGGVAREFLPSVSAVHDIQHAVEKVRGKQFRLILTEPGTDAVVNNLKELDDARDALAAARTRYERYIGTPEERGLYDSFVETWTAYDRQTEPVDAFMRAGQAAEAQRVMLSPWLRVLSLTAESKLARDVALNEARAARAADTTVASAGHARLGAFLMMLVAAVLAMAAMAVSYLRVIRPFASITAGMRRLASGDIGAPILQPRWRDEIGDMAAALAVFRDSLIRTREAEHARQRAQQFVEKVAMTTPDGIVGLDEDGTVTFWNAAAERLVGIPAGEMLGQPIAGVTANHDALDRDARLRGWHVLVGRTVDSEMTHRDGTRLPIELSVGCWQQDGRDMFCAIVRDIRARRAHEDILHRLAHLDPLTQLPNRTVLTTRMERLLEEGRPLTVLMADLDRFKQVNDILGHSIGDAVLRIAGQRLLGCVGPADTVTRIGGDEFVLLLADVGNVLRAATVADAVIASMSEPFCVEERTIHLSTSVGIAIAPSQADEADELLSCADLALYAAKADGRHGYRLFTHELRRNATEESACRQELRRAVDEGEFRLFYQPQIRLTDGALVGAEALIRWEHPVRGLLTPDRFLDVLENSRHAAEVGDWVIQAACRQAAAWRDRAVPDFRIGVNLSSAQFRAGNLAETVRTCLAEAKLPGSALEVEITEKIILRHDDALTEPLRQLQEAGVGIAFDDYGTGYASLSLLKRFPLTRLKIDRSFVRDTGDSTSDAAIIRAVLMLGRSLGLHVIAEGIETDQQLAWLKREGCVEGQGYLFGRPMPADDFALRFGLEPVAFGMDHGRHGVPRRGRRGARRA